MAMATQNGFERISGVVEQVTRKDKRTAVKLDGTWYSTFKEVPPVSQGDEVTLAYETVNKNDRFYYNIEELTVQASQREQKETHIARSVALKAAARWAAGVGERSTANVLNAAEQFLAWLNAETQADFSSIGHTNERNEDVPF